MLAYQHSGFSVDAGVCIEAHDRAALERLLRYCARPPFACARLRKEGAALVYRCAKQHSEPTGDKRGAKVDELTLTPLELIDRIAALVPPPRTRRRASGMPRAPKITILDSAFWWEIDQAAHCCGRCEGFTPVDGCFKGTYLGSYG